MSRSPVIKKVLEKALNKRVKGVRGGKQYKCAICKKSFSANKVQVDHIIPVVPLDKTVYDLSYDELVARIFCPIANLQVICIGCHKIKTAKERKLRKEHKNGNKI